MELEKRVERIENYLKKTIHYDPKTGENINQENQEKKAKKAQENKKE
jgi:hypothetical protein